MQKMDRCCCRFVIEMSKTELILNIVQIVISVVAIIFAIKELIESRSTVHHIKNWFSMRPITLRKTKIKISRLLKTLQKEKIHMAIVKNKNNKVAGIVTMEDILEELVGEIEDEYDEERDSIEELNQSEEVIVIDEENKPIE